jgi:hypothetical protein
VRVSTTAQTNNNVKIILKMKKNLFFLLFLAIIAVNCQKNINPSVSTSDAALTNVKQTSLFDEDKPIENDDVFKKINAFKAKIEKIKEGTMPESDNSTTIADAIWNIEALMNSQHGQAGKPFKKINTAKSTIRVALNDDGTISNTALVAALNEAQQKLTEQFGAVNGANKHIIAIDVSRKLPQIESNSSILLEVGIGVGFDSPYGPPPPPPIFGPDDDWLWGFHLGKCPMPTVSTNVGTDGADKLNESINPRFVSSDVFFTDLSDFLGNFSEFPNPNDPTPNNNAREFLLFHQNTSLPHSPCMVSADMIFYRAGAITVINQKKPAGKSFISIELVGTGVNDEIFHIVTILYGVKHNCCR